MSFSFLSELRFYPINVSQKKTREIEFIDLKNLLLHFLLYKSNFTSFLIVY